MYTIEDDSDETGFVNLIEIRDPYSKCTFKGKYNTTELKNKNELKVDPNSALLSSEEFLKYFTNVVICNYFDNYTLTTLSVNAEGRFKRFELKAHETNH